jgi:hypothetical protein
MSLSKAHRENTDWKPASNWLMFCLLTLVLLLIIHALVFFPHEYAHSFTAWLLGWKANPLALNYGHLNAGNILAQFDIDENVDYTPIFATGHNIEAGIIAAAGMVIGNVFITYPISLWGYYAAKRRQSHCWGLFFYWMCVASVGNFIDYVPVRTFSSHGDMHTLAIAFNCSPWWIIVVLGIPFAVALIYFYARFAPQAMQWLFPQSAARRAVTMVLTAFVLFGFYGLAGLSGYGAISHQISKISLIVLLPVMAIAGWWLTHKTNQY